MLQIEIVYISFRPFVYFFSADSTSLTARSAAMLTGIYCLIQFLPKLEQISTSPVEYYAFTNFEYYVYLIFANLKEEHDRSLLF